MKIPLSWIKEFVDLNIPVNKLAEILTLAGLEVDAVETLSPGFQGVVIGKVTHVEKHPDADQLRVAQVSDGKDEFQVVCGAPNCREGILTAFAMVGASLSDFKVKKAKLRGVESYGMLCSGKELGISEESEGIMEFDKHLQAGTDLEELYGETVIEISLTPNLNHCASMIGVAREIAVMLQKSVKIPEIEFTEEGGTIESRAKVTVEDTENCPRYACRVIEEVTVGPSPDWMQKRLEACGIRPVNNIVDVTNYVLLEAGHPLHAFDLEFLTGNEIIVRHPKEEEAFETLDGKTRLLRSEDLMICDSEKPVAIAGVMGGANSEVSDNTRNILLECAYFHPKAIRRTSKRLGLQSDSSKRFERGADPNQVMRSLDRAAMLILQLAGGKCCKGAIDIKQEDFAKKTVSCRLNRINRLLGTQLSISEVESIFERLELSPVWDGEDTFTLTIPTYRVDISEEVDLIEEVARVYGFANIPKPALRYRPTQMSHSPIFLFEREIRSRLIREGLQEFLTCDLIGPKILEAVDGSVMSEAAVVKVMNPTSIEQSILRTSLLPGLLQVAKYNIDRQNFDLSGFEVGRVHFKEEERYKEQSVAGIIMTGNARPYHWDPKPREVDFYDLKGVIENMLQELGVENIAFKSDTLKQFHPGRQASIQANGKDIGALGEIHPAILRKLDVPQRILFAEIDLHEIIRLRKQEWKMEEIPQYPGSERDWTITVAEKQEIQAILSAIQAVPSKILQEVKLLDIYRSEQLGKEFKNVTFHFVYRDPRKTIALQSVENEHARITTEVEKRIRREE